MKEMFPVKVTEQASLGRYGYLLKFKRDFPFTAGEVIGITLNKEDEPRLYSIASGASMKEVWILYTIKEDGKLTPELAKAKPGDVLYITRPFGQFICNDEKAVWIATGTGIAPFASMFFSGQYKNKVLIQGNRDKQGLYFYDSFIKEMGSNYLPCCSRSAHKDCFIGRVTDFVQSMEPLETNIPYYLCGTAEMVVDVRDILIDRGVPYDKIMAEIFF